MLEKVMSVETEPIEMDAGRVCDAIAKIGYSPAAALMDIVDNSIAATATHVLVEFELKQGKTLGNRNNMATCRICDDGNGMSNDEIKNALKLGSLADYPDGSLSKYGMGLKSAGFSLGSRIQIVSKQNNKLSKKIYVDRAVIREEGYYAVCSQELNEDEIEIYNKRISGKKGTVIEISGCQSIQHTSASRTIKKLEKQLGVIYFHFLADKKLQLEVKDPKKTRLIQPHDIFFKDIAGSNFSPDSYTGKIPIKVLNERLQLSKNKDEKPIELEVYIFPKDQLKNCVDFSVEERAQIKSYDIKRKNMGFFIYRNNRLIKWADTLDGIARRDDLGFRASLKIQTCHDDLLHVDVSKQNLAIPDDALDTIATLVRTAQKQHKKAFELCDEILSKQDEGTPFNERNEDLAVEDLDQPQTEDAVEKQLIRQKAIVEKSQQHMAQEDLPKEEEDQFKKIIYSEKVSSSNLWDAEFDQFEGSFVRINRNHEFYRAVLNRLSPTSSCRQALEAMIWAAAASETTTLSNLSDLDPDTITAVLNKFKKIFSNTIDNWSNSNQDLF